MGLTIHYDITAPKGTTKRQAINYVRQIQEYADALVAEGVAISSTPFTYMTAADIAKLERNDDLGWIKSTTTQLVPYTLKTDLRGTNTKEWAIVPALEGVIFEMNPAKGSEYVTIGLFKYPSSVTYVQPEYSRLNRKTYEWKKYPTVTKKIRTGFTGRWTFGGFTKTIYASEYGVANFVTAHLTVVAILEFAQSLGLEVDVRDESDYWEHRDINELVRQGAADLAMLAAVNRIFKNVAGSEVESSVSSMPNLEELEEQGRELMTPEQQKTAAEMARVFSKVRKIETEDLFKVAPTDTASCIRYMTTFYDLFKEQALVNETALKCYNEFMKAFEGKYISEIKPDKLIALLQQYIAETSDKEAASEPYTMPSRDTYMQN